MRPKSSKNGMSLVELIVTIGIMSVVVVGAFQVFTEGIRLFRTNQSAADAQSSAIKTLGRISTEMVNTDSTLVQTYEAPDISGITFASPLDANGRAQFHPVSGDVYWQRYVCYYFVPDPSTPAKGKLYRKEEPIATATDPDTIAGGYTGNPQITTIRAGLASRSTAYFAADSSFDTKLLGDAVSGFVVREFDGTVEEEDGSTRDTLGGASVTEREYSVDVILEAGDKNDNGPSGYYIRVDSRVTPRG